MLILDTFFYAMIFVLALVFSLETFDTVPSHGTLRIEGKLSDDNSDVEAMFRWGRLIVQAKFFLFGMMAGLFWMILAVLTINLNNCMSTFSETCFTSPTFATTTATASPFTYGTVMGWGFGVFAIIWWVVIIFLAFGNIYSHSVSAAKEAESDAGTSGHGIDYNQ